MSILDYLSPLQVAGRAVQISSRAVDVVAILGAGYVPLFASARPLSATIFETADLMEHPIENGAVISDHLVVNPIEIAIPLVCIGDANYRTLFPLMRTYFRSGLKVTVMTKAGAYFDMVIIDLPHEETPAAFNAINIAVRLREAIVVTAQSDGLTSDEAADPSQQSTQARGAQQTTTPSASAASSASSTYGTSGAGATPQGSTLYQWFGQ